MGVSKRCSDVRRKVEEVSCLRPLGIEGRYFNCSKSQSDFINQPYGVGDSRWQEPLGKIGRNG